MSLDRRLEGAPELMDAPDVEPAELRESLEDLRRVNRWLGGRWTIVRAVDRLPPRHDGPLRLLDVGAGGADIPRAIVRRFRARERDLRVVAVEPHPESARIARELCSDYPEISVLRADGLMLPFPDGEFDIALLSLTLHHLEDDAPRRMLAELSRVAGGRLLVSELERGRLNLLGARALAATLWRRKPVIRHDAPLSVRRAFTAAELEELGRAAGLRAVRVRSFLRHRLLMSSDPEAE